MNISADWNICQDAEIYIRFLKYISASWNDWAHGVYLEIR